MFNLSLMLHVVYRHTGDTEWPTDTLRPLTQLDSVSFSAVSSSLQGLWDPFRAITPIVKLQVRNLDDFALPRGHKHNLEGLRCVETKQCLCRSDNLSLLLNEAEDLERIICGACFQPDGKLSKDGRHTYQKLWRSKEFNQALKRNRLTSTLRRDKGDYGLVISRGQALLNKQ